MPEGDQDHTMRSSAFALCSLAAFCATLPFLLPNLDILHRLMMPVSDGTTPLVVVGNDMSFLRAAALAAMFAALGMLLVCLLKTAYGRLTYRFACLAGVLYVAGCAIVDFVIPGMQLASPLILLTGIAVGFGGAVLCMAWVVQVRTTSYRTVLRWLVLLALVAALFDLVLVNLPVAASTAAHFVVAAFGAFGCLLSFRATSKHIRSVTVPGSNWWDVFGRLDVSMVEGTDDFNAPAARALFFVVTPALVALLVAMAMDMHHTALPDELPLEAFCALAACACAVPLLILKSEASTMQFAYRVYLPVVAVAVFVVGNFTYSDLHGAVIDGGVLVFCTLWILLIGALILTMACRMQSLRLPAACLLVLAVCIIALTSYMEVDAGWLEDYKFGFLMVLLLAVIVLMAAIPSARIWSIVTSDAALAALAAPADSTLEQRCDAVARTYGLTARESEILRFLGRGHGSAYIANELVVAESTVRSHVKSIYRKTGVNSREQLIECIDSQELGESNDKHSSEQAR